MGVRFPQLLLMALMISGVLTARLPGQSTDSNSWKASGASGAVITGCREAADAGLSILQSDGNAIDAAVATMLVQSVIESSLACFGGEVPIMVYDADRQSVEVVVGLGAAPRLATADWFRENREGVIQGRGDIANCVVPGFLDALLTALDRYGTKTFGECAQPMLAVLRTRAALSEDQVRELSGRRGGEIDAQRWLTDQKNFLRTIERLVEVESQSADRQLGLRRVADFFYRGPLAREIDTWSQANGGLLRFVDFAQHHTRIEQPLQIEFAGHTICKCGVWSQGPFLLQTLSMLDDLDRASIKRESDEYVHLVVETMKLCFADRDAQLGDPEFVDVPIQQLLSEEYLSLRRALIDPATASLELRPGDPIGPKALSGKSPQDHQIVSGHSNDTSNCLVADRWGNVVAATPSGWGGVMAGSTGVQLGSRMIGLTTWPNHASFLEPGKRPRITLTPTLVLRDGRPVLAISVAGGDQQDQASIQVLLNRLVFQLDPELSVRSPRFGTDHHINWFGHKPAQLGSLTLPRGTDESTVESLRAKGHQLVIGTPAARAVLLDIDLATGQKQAVGEDGRNAAAY